MKRPWLAWLKAGLATSIGGIVPEVEARLRGHDVEWSAVVGFAALSLLLYLLRSPFPGEATVTSVTTSVGVDPTETTTTTKVNQ